MSELDFAQIWWWMLLVTVPVALVTGARLFLIERREHSQRTRLEEYRGMVRTDPGTSANPSWAERIAALFSPIVGVVEQERLKKLLITAGLRGEVSLANFIAAKAVAAVVLVSVTWLSHLFATVMIMRFAAIGAAFLIGWRLPDLILNRLIKARRLRLQYGLPDALDLLVICAEAGLSLNQAVEEISHQLRLSNKDMADEFAFTSAEMRLLPDFAKALDNLAERTGLANLQSLIATLKQSLKYGTPLAESLRTIAAEMRAERHARMEEKAARLPVLLAVPMMTFILPCLLMIVGTPVALRIFDTFRNINFGGASP